MRSLLLLLSCALGCKAVTYTDRRLDAAVDSPVDAEGVPNAKLDAAPPAPPPPKPTFVQNVPLQCGANLTCTIPVPGSGVDQLLLVSITASPGTVRVSSVKNKTGQAFERVIGPVTWAANKYDTELWWGKRSQSAEEIAISFSVKPTASIAYVDEFVATAIDQTTSATGTLAAAGSFATGTKPLTAVPQIVFGHAEADGPVVSVGAGFTTRSTNFANIEETKSVSTAGSYEATFKLDVAGTWMAMMATLR